MFYQWNVSFTEFGVHLAELTVDTQGPLAIRQLSSVLLRQYVDAHWYKHADKFREPEVPEQVSLIVYEFDFFYINLHLNATCILSCYIFWII